MRRFGRNPSPFDERDYNLRNFIPLGADLSLDGVDEKNWEYPSTPLDQLDTQHCVGFSMANFGINLPIFRPYTNDDAHRFYYLCKEYEGRPLSEEGSSMRAAAEVLLSLKKIEAYAFAPDMAVIKWWLLNRGPLMVGTIWTTSMMTPIDNIITVGGELAGGHAYLINEWTLNNYIGIQNSWGNNWGVNGKAYISLADFEKLFTYYGEAVATVDLDDAVIPVDPPAEEEPVIPPATNKGCFPVLASLMRNGHDGI